MSKMLRKMMFWGFICASLQSCADTDVSQVATETVDWTIGKATETVDFVKSSFSKSSADDITVSFVDVGQGDCTIIKDNNEFMVIDTGTYEAYPEVKKVLNKNGCEVIDVLVLTHPDADHIQSAASLIGDYEVREVYMPTAKSDSKTYKRLMQTIELEDTMTFNPKNGDYIGFGKADYQFIVPKTEFTDTNSNSLVIKMENDEDSFLFCGDATGAETDELLESGISVDVDVYKAAHHGSAQESCNDEEWLNEVSPESVIVSCGYKNSYGHPHIELMEYLRSNNIELYRTDLQSTIVAHSTGNGIKWDTDTTKDFRNGNKI